MSPKDTIISGFKNQFRETFYVMLGKVLADLTLAGLLFGICYGTVWILGALAPVVLNRYIVVAKSSLFLLATVHLVVVFLFALFSHVQWRKKQVATDHAMQRPASGAPTRGVMENVQ